MMSNQPKIPVLMYHALTEQRNEQLSPLHIPIQLFKREIEWLAANNYQTLTLTELPARLDQNKSNDKYCVISFDDGYQSLYEYAMPVLKQYGFTATLYLTTAIVGHENFNAMQNIDPLTIPAGDRPLRWDELKQMIGNGWLIESHSVSHADHSKISHEQLLEELCESKKIIEQQLDQPVFHYAFPFGKYNTTALKLVRKAGYRSAATVHPGLCKTSTDRYRLPRLEMNCNDDLDSFIKKVETGFNSPREKVRSSIRDLLFRNSRVKDLSKKIGGGRVN